MANTKPNTGSFQKGSEAGKEFRFVKGHATWNRGKPMHLSPSSEWKEGDTEGAKHPFWKGGVQNIRNDCVYVWGGRANIRLRRPRVVYAQTHGEIPKGFVIFHRDGDRHNDAPENLEAISRKELSFRNSQRRWEHV